MTEAELQRQVVKLARPLGILVGITPDSRRAFSGEPDLRLAGVGGVIWAELKSEMGETSAAQDRWLWLLHKAGEQAYVWRPADLESGLIRHELEAIA